MNHTPDDVFLLNGMRFKLSFNNIYCDECGEENDRVTVEPLGMYANELQGRWVALVPAENDRHLELLNLKKQRDELLDELLRVKEICLRECGIGIVNELVIASVKEKK